MNSLFIQLKLSIVTHDLMNKPQPTFSYSRHLQKPSLETRPSSNQPTTFTSNFFFIFNVIYKLIHTYQTRSRLTTIVARNWWNQTRGKRVRIESRKGEREEQDESRQGCGQFESSALLAAIEVQRCSWIQVYSLLGKERKREEGGTERSARFKKQKK